MEISENNKRNFCILSHVDHGKTTLSDHLISMGGLLPPSLAGKLRALDFLDVEQQRGITVETSVASFEFEYEDAKYKINLLDTPGHVDFGNKTQEAIRLVENGLVLVDAVEGVRSQTRNVLFHAVQENLNLVLFINKIDRLITELHLDSQRIRQRIEVIIGDIHHFCEKYKYKGEIPNFNNGKVIFGSATDNWALDRNSIKGTTSFDSIIKFYSENQNLSSQITVTNVFKKIFADIFLPASRGILEKLKINDLSDANPVILTGQRFIFQRSSTIGSISRIANGQVVVGDGFYSNKLDQKVLIEKIVSFKGRKQIVAEVATSGDIFGLQFNKHIPVGDILTVNEKVVQTITQDTYYQVIQIAVEPKSIDELDLLKNKLKLLEALNPGVGVIEDASSGEIVISGIGTLQLEIILDEIQKSGMELSTQKPKKILTVQPTESIEYSSDAFHARIDPDKAVGTNPSIITAQGFNSNSFSITSEPFSSKEFNLGIRKSFIDNIKNLYPFKVEIMNFHLTLGFKDENTELSYENGLITGNKIWRKIYDPNKIKIHEPYYELKITTPSKYIGEIVNAVKTFQGEIMAVQTEEEAEIKAVVGVLEAIEMADTLRQITDGYVLWNRVGVIFKVNELAQYSRYSS